MPTNLFRRLRGAASLIAVWSIGWGIVGSVAGGLLTTFVLWSQGLNPPLMALFFAFGIAGAIAGAVSGAAFALAVTAAGRTESLNELSAARLGVWSALPALGVAALMFGFDPVLLLATGILGLVAGAGTITLARRSAIRGFDREALPSGRW